MRINLIGAFVRNAPFGTEIAFKKGFDRLGGHVITTCDTSYKGQPWDLNADVTVVFKWMENDYWDLLDATRGKKIVYQPDDLRFPHIKKMMQDMRRYCDYAFTFDADGAKLALEYGYSKAQRLLLTADDELYHPLPDVKKDIDVSFVGSLSGGGNHRSRMRMCQLVGSIPGIKTAFVNGLYNIEELNGIYNRSKIVLNHATDVGQPFGHGFGYQCRHFEAGFTRACILSNQIDNENVLAAVEQFHDEDSLIGKVNMLLSNETYRHSLANGLFAELRAAHRPEHRAAEMIRFVEAL